MRSDDDYSLYQVGELRGHGGWVTGLCTGNEDKQDLLVSVSRDKSLLIWKLDVDYRDSFVSTFSGRPHRSLQGHSHYISDVVLSSDNNFALTGSWDTTMRLWDLRAGRTTYRFVGHTKDVLSVTMSPDNRQIMSGSRDKTMKLWNTLAECKYTFDDHSAHTDWVSCVRYTPTTKDQMIISAGWDRNIKLWDQQTFSLTHDLQGHEGCINAITLSPDGKFCASGGKDCMIIMWNIAQKQNIQSMETYSSINALAFSPSEYWLAAATDDGIKIWNLGTKSLMKELRPEVFASDGLTRVKPPSAISLAWSNNGKILYAGFSDGIIRAYGVQRAD